MIKSVKVINHRNDEMLMVLNRPEYFAITSITGLDPVKANINMTELSLADGSVYNSSKKSNRNIVISFKILPRLTIEEARHVLYSFFPLKKPVTLEIETDTRTVRTIGYVESNEVEIFSKDETAQVSIVCPESDFYSVKDNAISFNGFYPTFEFPFSNPVGEETLKFGEISTTNYAIIDYEGESNTGLTFVLDIGGEVSGIEIRDMTRGTKIHIDDAIVQQLTGGNISRGDRILLCTEKGRKSIYLIREENEYNILAAIGMNSIWFELEQGINTFLLHADSGQEYVHCTVYHHILYEGI